MVFQDNLTLTFLDRKDYKTGIKISDKQMKNLNLKFHDLHPQWNYTIIPRTKSWSFGNFRGENLTAKFWCATLVSELRIVVSKFVDRIIALVYNWK